MTEETTTTEIKKIADRSYATGRRKEAVARVWIKPGSGKITINGKDQEEYFARPVLQMILRQPFQVAGVENEFDVMATVAGGGLLGIGAERPASRADVSTGGGAGARGGSRGRFQQQPGPGPGLR